MTLTSLYVYRDFVILHPQQQTTAGFWLAAEPYLKLSLNDPAKIAVTLVRLSAQEYERADSIDVKERLRPLLDLAGCLTWKEFAKSSKLVLVESENGKLRLIPQNFDAETTAFQDGDQVFEVANNLAEAIQFKIEEALLLCNID